MYTANYDYPKNVLRLDGADGGKLMELPLNVRFNYNGKDTFFTEEKTVVQYENQILVCEEDVEIASRELKLTMLEDAARAASPSERVKINKQIAKIKDQSLEIGQFEEKIHHLADQMIAIDLDDGVKVNYAKFQDVLEKIK